MKGAIAAFVAAVARVQAEGGPLRGSVSLLITGDEEGPAVNGTVKVLDWLAERGELQDACIVGEQSNPAALGEMITLGRRGRTTRSAELLVWHGGVQTFGCRWSARNSNKDNQTPL